jgi:GTP-binding protein EngB required for normal cell division/uncharacterized protein (DUF697 family)
MEHAASAQESYAEELAKAQASLGRVNVLVAGIAGAGKSTLVNTVLGRRLAATGEGRPITRNITQYTYPKVPIAIYDTGGFEIRDSGRTISAVRDKLLELRSATDPNQQIHIAWLCILEQSHRVEPVHCQFLEMLREIEIPTVVVLTQALHQKEMLNAACRYAIPNDGVVPLMAEPKRIGSHVVAAHGIDVLMELTSALLPRARRSAFIAAQNASWRLKEQAVSALIQEATQAAVLSAPLPGHSVILGGLQIRLMCRINTFLGLSLREENQEEYFKELFVLFLAHCGGTTAFGLALSEFLKCFPGLGTVGATVIGGTVGGVITNALGHLYFDSVSREARQNLQLPSREELTSRMEKALRENRGYYVEQAQRGLSGG